MYKECSECAPEGVIPLIFLLPVVLEAAPGQGETTTPKGQGAA